jgi:hypothetical protein
MIAVLQFLQSAHVFPHVGVEHLLGLWQGPQSTTAAVTACGLHWSATLMYLPHQAATWLVQRKSQVPPVVTYGQAQAPPPDDVHVPHFAAPLQ